MAGAGRYWWIWIAVAPVVAWAAVRVLGFDSGFPAESILPFTPYVAVAALLVFGIAMGLENWAAAALAGLATVCLVGSVLPRTIGGETVPAAGHETLKILAANVYEGRADPEALVALVDRLHPDVLSVEELTASFAHKLSAAGIGSRLRYSLPGPDGGAGCGDLYSRLPIRELPARTHASFCLRIAELSLPAGRRIRIVGVHTFPPQSAGSTKTWEESLASLPSAGRGTPWVLAGDFNGTFDQSPFRDLVGRGYRDAGQATGKGLEPTFPRAYHAIPPITIDHVLADRRLGVVEYSVEELPGSDHRAVYAELALPRR